MSDQTLQVHRGCFITDPLVHQSGRSVWHALCGQPMDVGNEGRIVNCPGCWKVMGFCEKCGCPPEKTCGHEATR